MTEQRSIAIRIEDLYLAFGDTQVLKGIDLEIQPGELFAFLGPSGSGKSTLLRAIAGFGPEPGGRILLGSDDGVTVWLDGKRIHRNPAERGVTPDQDKVAVEFKAGRHVLVLRVDQGRGGWGFCLRLADAKGKSPLAGVTLRAPKLPAPKKPKKE